MGRRQTIITWRCQCCHESAAAVTNYQRHHGLHHAHQALCRGLSPDGHPLGIMMTCVVPGCSYRPSPPSSAGAWQKHYLRTHKTKLGGQIATLADLQLVFNKDLLPTVDLNARFGLFYTRGSPVTGDPALLQIQHEYIADPMGTTCKHLTRLLEDYRKTFSEFFGGAIPLTFHLHVSDASVQVMIKCLAFLQGMTDAEQAAGLLTKDAITTARLAHMDGIYGAWHGPLAHNAVYGNNQLGASGPKPASIRRGLSRHTIRKRMQALKTEGYLGIVVELVSSKDGAVMPAEEWHMLAESCDKAGLLLIVDEALTAIRSGAPFAHLRPEYRDSHPSFVLFGKGLFVSGLAVHADGVSIRRLGLGSPEIRSSAARWLDRLPSEVVKLPDLVNSLALVQTAARKDWCSRAEKIGANLRTIALGLPQVKHSQPVSSPTDSVTGLAALLYIRRPVAVQAALLGASAGDQYVRWIPYLDASMEEEAKVRELLGASSSVGIRSQLIKVLGFSLSPACVVCGEYHETQGVTWCRTCHLAICPTCAGPDNSVWSAAYQRHMDGQCLGEEANSSSQTPVPADPSSQAESVQDPPPAMVLELQQGAPGRRKYRRLVMAPPVKESPMPTVILGDPLPD
ncbi:hypothetical protein GQ53DRAFT_405355 [Thozetella sp. PMI_491]|nr:hypothetical protein GQ53DRAFT_405355 [Thozetella sp. PMI_491]